MLFKIIFQSVFYLKSLIFTILFFERGKGSIVYVPDVFNCSKKPFIGTKSNILMRSFIMTVRNSEDDLDGSICIGNDVSIGRNFAVVAGKEIRIESGVLVADNVHITDINHRFSNLCVPIKGQGNIYVGKVLLEEGCWIGANVVIVGASVGRNTVVGANSVVTKSLPDNCVAAGAPARIIRFL